MNATQIEILLEFVKEIHKLGFTVLPKTTLKNLKHLAKEIDEEDQK